MTGGMHPAPDSAEAERFADASRPDEDRCAACGETDEAAGALRGCACCDATVMWIAARERKAIERLRAAVAAMTDTITF